MVDLSRSQRGTIGPSCWFSDLFVAALEGHFTGGTLVHTEAGHRVLFFRNGDPVHAMGPGFRDKYLGQIVGELGLLPAATIMDCIRYQEQVPAEERPLLGQVLQTRAGLSENAVQRAVRLQIEARFADCFGVEDVAFQSAPGEDARVKEVGIQVDGWAVLLRGLTEHGCSTELRATTDAILGKSIRLKGSLRQLQALTRLPKEVELGLRYLEKPRRPDHLERVLGRRRARGLFRFLALLDLLEILPKDRNIPIPKANPLKEQALSELEALAGGGDRPASGDWGSSTPTPPPEPAPPPKTDPSLRARFTEIDSFFADLEHLDHFQVLGVDRDDTPTLVRKRFTDLAKKFHPDALTGRHVPPEIAEKIRAIAARINEAYKVLASTEARLEYEASLASSPQSTGASPRIEQIKDAAGKAKMAAVHIKQKNFSEARALLRQALDRNPHDRSYGGLLAWAMIADARFDREDALREGIPLLLEAIKHAEENADFHFYLGRAYKEQGDLTAALRHFKKAEGLDENYTNAVREVRLLRKQVGGGEGGASRKGPTTGWFGLGNDASAKKGPKSGAQRDEGFFRFFRTPPAKKKG